MGEKKTVSVIDFPIQLEVSEHWLSLPESANILEIERAGEGQFIVRTLLDPYESRDVAYAIRKHEVELDGGMYRDECVIAYPDNTFVLHVTRRTVRDLTIWTFEPTETQSKDRKLLVRASSRDIEHPIKKVRYLRSFLWLKDEGKIIRASLFELL